MIQNYYVIKKIHGKVVDSTFMPSNAANSSPIVALHVTVVS